MKFGRYLLEKSLTLSFLGIGAVMGAAFLLAAGLSPASVGWLLGLIALLTLVWLLCGRFAESRKAARIRLLTDRVEDPLLLGEIQEKPGTAMEEAYFALIRRVSHAAISQTEEAVREKEEYCAYVERWIHEIKTPLTACSLILDNGRDPRRLRRELKRADNLTEEILTYARLRTAANDVSVGAFEADEVMDHALQAQRELLTEAGIRVETEGTFSIYSDKRAVSFLLQQCLVNCAKYCPRATVSLLADGRAISVLDNGPVIPLHELPLVTERGFIGTSGRRAGGGTGMGLYLARELSKKLGIAFDVASKEGAYTKITLTFP